MNRTLDFITKNFLFAAKEKSIGHGVGPYPGYVPIYERKRSDNEYGDDQNPYQPHLDNIEVEYNPVNRQLTLIPKGGPNYGKLSEKRDMLSIILLPEQAKVFDYFEDSIHKDRLGKTHYQNSQTLKEFADAKTKELGFKEWRWQAADRTLVLYPDYNDKSKGYVAPVKIAEPELIAAGIKLNAEPQKKHYLDRFKDVEAFVKGLCKFAAEDDPYEDYFFKSTVKFDHKNYMLSIVPDLSRYGYDDDKAEIDTIRIALTPEQAKAFERIEDQRLSSEVSDIKYEDEYIVDAFAEKYIAEHGLKDYDWYWRNDVLEITPPWDARSQSQPITLTKQQLEQAGVKFNKVPQRKVWGPPPQQHKQKVDKEL